MALDSDLVGLVGSTVKLKRVSGKYVGTLDSGETVTVDAKAKTWTVGSESGDSTAWAKRLAPEPEKPVENHKVDIPEPQSGPVALEHEMAVLGSMILSDRAAEEMALALTPEDFARPAHSIIFRAMKYLIGLGKPATDIELLKQELIDAKKLSHVGGEEYLIEMASFVPSPANVRHYAQIVKDKAYRRAIATEAKKLARLAQDEDLDLADVYAQTAHLVALPSPCLNGKHDDWGGFVLASEVPPERVNWLVRPFLPRGLFTMLQGDPGIGKSSLVAAIAAIVTQGLSLPGLPFEGAPGGAVIITAEDSLKYQVVPKLRDQGADLSRVALFEGRKTLDKAFIADIEKTIKRIGAVWIAIDPIMAFFDAKTDIHRQNETRECLDLLIRLCERLGVCVTGLVHLNKGESTKAIYRAMGSIDFIAAPRVALMAGPDPDDKDRRALAIAKSNIGPDNFSVGYTIESIDEDRIRIDFTGPSELTGERMCEQPDRRRNSPKRGECEDWILAQLAYGACESQALRIRAKEAGFSNGLFYEARRALGKEVEETAQPRKGRGGSPAVWWGTVGTDWRVVPDLYDPWADE